MCFLGKPMIIPFYKLEKLRLNTGIVQGTDRLARGKAGNRGFGLYRCEQEWTPSTFTSTLTLRSKLHQFSKNPSRSNLSLLHTVEETHL